MFLRVVLWVEICNNSILMEPIRWMSQCCTCVTLFGIVPDFKVEATRSYMLCIYSCLFWCHLCLNPWIYTLWSLIVNCKLHIVLYTRANPLMVQWYGISLSTGTTRDQYPVVALLVRDLSSKCEYMREYLPWKKRQLIIQVLLDYHLSNMIDVLIGSLQCAARLFIANFYWTFCICYVPGLPPK